jgi:DNA adenine methylase
MILRRLGNKTKIADKVQAYFPPHNTYIEPFFGAGGMFFNKPRAKYNIVNDNDSEVFNLYNVVQARVEELIEAVETAPYHSDLWEYWKANKESDPVRKAVRFLFLSNFGFMGKPETLKFGLGDAHKILLANLKKAQKSMSGVQFMNCDFRDVLGRIAFRDKESEVFVYCDPPYLGTTNNYETGFTETDSADLFTVMVASGLKFGISEFDHPFIIDQAKQHGLHMNTIGERCNLGNRRTEVLITNYEAGLRLF